MKRVINGLFRRAGFTLSRIRRESVAPAPYQNDAMYAALERYYALQPSIATIFDIGAAAGSWTLAAKKLWKDSTYVLFEPLRERVNELTALATAERNIHFVPRAAGKGKTEVQFYVSDDLDGSGVVTGATSNASVRTVLVTSIDLEALRLKTNGPYIVKLDTHGFEVPILEGAAQIWDDIALFIIECYGFQIAPNSLLFWEMCQYMDARGFRLFDIVDVMRRSKDNAFWQCDAFFIPKNNAVFQSNQYL